MSEGYDEGLSRADVLDWRPWRFVTTEDRAAGATGLFIPEATDLGPLSFPLANVPRFPITAGVYTHAPSTALVLVGAYTNYHWASGDRLSVTAITGAGTSVGNYAIAAKADDDTLTVNLAANATAVTASIIQTKRYIEPGPFGAIWIRAFGSLTNLTADVRITGWMDPSGRSGCGKGFILWSGQWICGAGVGLPVERGFFDPNLAYAEVDTFTATAGYDICGAVKYGIADGQNMLLIPTLGYPVLLLEVINTVTEVTETDWLGVIWRPEVVGMLA